MTDSTPETGPAAGFVFVVGGARSGKSTFAEALAVKSIGPRAYLATAQALDSEMRHRIGLHQRSRGESWDTVEEPVEVAGRLRGLEGYGVVLIDCLTLWVTNLIGAGRTDAGIIESAEELAGECKAHGASVIVVSNEVGLGIVPDNPLARRFRDVAGLVNQRFAARAEKVFFTASGLPLRIK